MKIRDSFSILLAASLMAVGLRAYSQSNISEQTKMSPRPSFQERRIAFKNKSVEELIVDLKIQPSKLPIAHRLRNLGDKKAIPSLAAAFETSKDKTTRQAVAAALVSLKVSDEKYWEFLAGHGNAAVNDGSPSPIVFDQSGKSVRGMSSEFKTWAEQNEVDVGVAAQKATRELPNDLLFLGLAGDQRAIPIFLRGLDSLNPLIVRRSAQGLARLGYEEASGKIFSACEKMPAEAASLVAESVAFLKNAKSHQWAKGRIGKERWEFLRERAQKVGRKGVYGEDF